MIYWPPDGLVLLWHDGLAKGGTLQSENDGAHNGFVNYCSEGHLWLILFINLFGE